MGIVIEDAALVRRVARGDALALGLIFDRHASQVRSLARRILGSDTDADDVVQETFLRLWRNAAGFEAERASLATFLSVVARNLCFDRLRSKTRHPTVHLPDADVLPLVAATDPLEGAEFSEASAALHAAVRWLPERERQIVELAYFGGQTQSEIAMKTAIPLGTVKKRARNALRLLRAVLRRSLGVET